jgi:TIR domain
MGDGHSTARQDFFVSYASADQAWAEWIAWELEQAGYTSVLQAWDFVAGTSFAHAMQQAATATDHTLAVLSRAYLHSRFGEAEWLAAFVNDPLGEGRRLLPVRIEACEPEGLLAVIVYVDLVGLDEAAARARLLEEVAGALRGHRRPDQRPRFPLAPAPAALGRPRFPTALPPVWNLPWRRNPDFTGREAELAALAAVLDSIPGAVAVTQAQAIQGTGGIGKTSLAVEYAYRHHARFEVVWWLRAEEPASLVGDYAALANALGLPEAAQADQQQAALAVRGWLAANGRWLLVVDNAPEPQALTGLAAPLAHLVDLLPQVIGGQVLVTSRDARWDEQAELMELDLFTPEEAVQFLLRRTDSADEEAAAGLAELLGYLALALEQAGAYIRETRISVAAFLSRLRQSPARALAQGRPRDRNPTDTVATTWQVSIEQVGSVPGAVKLLEVCAFLASEDIPRRLFAQRVGGQPEELAVLAADPFALDAAVAALHRYAIVKANEHALAVHRLVQQVIRDRLAATVAAERAGLAVRLLAEVFPPEGLPEARGWAEYQQLLPHVMVAVRHAERHGVESAVTRRLGEGIFKFLEERSRDLEAFIVAERDQQAGKVVERETNLQKLRALHAKRAADSDLSPDEREFRTSVLRALIEQEEELLASERQTLAILDNMVKAAGDMTRIKDDM